MARKTTKNATVNTEAIEVQATETPAIEANTKKVNKFMDIEAVMALYAEYGIRCANPTAKGAYRIMGGGSSLNVKPTKGYYIYSNDVDLDIIRQAGLECKDLVVEEGTNTDKKRRNIVICTEEDTLRKLLALYATNPANQVVQAQ